MKQTKKMNCIVCPLGCLGEVSFNYGNDGGVIDVEVMSGFSCPRGKNYAIKEMTNPERMLTTTVRVENGALPLLPVVSKTALPKGKVMAAARYLAGITIKAPVAEGQVICLNILGLGVDIIASRDMNTHA
ncbi:MAG: DUF1667 domain-containing protein [Negativicutes bacterium]|jgi:CxxC motif-containing protein